MKKHIIIVAAIILAVALVTAAAVLLTREPATGTISQSSDRQGGTAAGETSGSYVDQVAGEATGQKQIIIYTCDKELEVIVSKYAKMHPEFNYKIVCHENDGTDFFFKLNRSLQNYNGNKVDLYCLPDSYAQWYIKGDYSDYACTYKELGIEVEAALKKADIPQTIIDSGTRPDGELIALPYKKNVNLFMYRRSIAKDIWGTDDPDKIAGIIGAGTGKWDRFLEAAQTVKKHGAYMLASTEELADFVSTDISSDLLSDGNYGIDPKWEEFMDISKSLLDKDYSMSIPLWSEDYIKALDGAAAGDKPVFGFFTDDQSYREKSKLLIKTAGDWAVCLPSVSVDTDSYMGILVNKASFNKDALGPLIEWITLDCSETGLQHSLANDTFYTHVGDDELKKYGGKRAVVSGTVMKNAINSDSFLGGQNINTVIHNAHLAQTGKHHAPGIKLFRYWLNEVKAYITGERDKETAVADYRKAAIENARSDREMFTGDGFSFSADGKLFSLLDTRVLNIYSYDEELPRLVEYYAQGHPEFNFKVKYYNYPMMDNFYTLSVINEKMQSDSNEVVDIYCVPDVYSHEVMKGEYSRHACTYKELGIDVETALEKADIPQYMIDAGTNLDGDVISLPYLSCANVFVYRRSVARDVWGTDDPQKIAGIIGAGTNKWDSFLDAAQTLKEHGCYIVPGFRDISDMIDTSLAASVMKSDEAGGINPKWQEFMDVAEKMKDKGYMPGLQYYWNDERSKLLNGEGDKPAFGFVIPYDTMDYIAENYLKSTAGDWAICVPPFKTIGSINTGILVNKDSPNKDALGPLIEWLTLDCSETGLQYNLVNDTLIDKENQRFEFRYGKRTAVSGTVLENTDCCVDFLGGQNINPVIYDAINAPIGKHSYFGIETDIFSLWLDETAAYLAGVKDRNTAVADFKKAEKATIDWQKKIFEDYGISFLLP